MNYLKISRSFLAFLTILVLIMGVMPWGGFIPKVQAATLDPAQWAHRRSITIDNSSNADALTDYQVKVDTSDVFYDEDGLVGSWHMNEMSKPDANNIIDPSTWTVGTGSVAGFTRNGDDAENYRINATDPSGGQTVIWEARPTATSGADGGWNGSLFPIDPTKTYRFSVWVQRPVQGNGHFYLGTHGYDASGTNVGVLKRNDGSNSTNPYFTVNSNWTEWGDNSSWYLAVGHIWPAGSGTGSNRSDSGIYNTSGSLIYTSDLMDYVWRPEDTQSNLRTYLYYSTDTSTRQRWAYPRVDAVDSSEPSIADLVKSAPTGVISDSSGYNNNGTVMNDATLTTGKFGEALSLDGANDQISIPGSSSLELSTTDAITLEAWIYPTGDPTDDRGTIITKNGSYYLQHYIDDRIAVYTYYDGGGSSYFYSTSTVTRNAWNHVVFTEDGGGYRRIYINGQPAGDGQFEASIRVYSGAVTIGGQGTTRFFHGLIDEARVYNRALSPQEIQDQYDASDVRLDYGDVRFTDSDGSTLLNYWMEKDDVFWIKVPSIPASSTATIYMYYGNPSAGSISSGEDTFQFFDDFENGSIDLSKWPTQSLGGYITETGGELKVTGVYAGNYYIQTPAYSTSDIPMIITAKTKTLTLPGNGWSPVLWWQSTTEGASFLDHPTDSNYCRNDSTWINHTGRNLSEWHKEKIILTSTSGWIAKAEYQDTASYDWTESLSNTFSGTYYIRIGPRHDNTDYGLQVMDGRVAYIYSRKYASPEPIITINAENFPPSVPVHLYANNSINPTDVTNSSPTLSAEYDDLDTSDTASFYEIQIIADGGDWASPYWDSTKKACSVNEGDRLQVTYGGSALNLSQQKYYQRWKFWDSIDEGSWSDGLDYFITATPKNEYGANVRGYAWSDDAGWLSFNNSDITSYVASYNSGTGAIEGWAWSDGIGWISFDCASDTQCNPSTADHSVIVDGSGDLSGDAWSDNLGWLSFNRAETGNPPGDPYQASGAIAHYDSATKEFSGWAKFLSAPEGGWDGWIKLRCYGAECDANGWTEGTGSMSGAFVNDSGYLEGWAWGSDVVGWIGFKGPGDVDYGVNVDESSNKLSGHAWSENLGWISFDRDETGTPPSDDPCIDESCIAKLRTDNYQVDGWARALNYGDGWDGWISLNQKTGDSFAYEVSLNTDSKEFEGWAYGSDVLGWISFNHLTDGSSVDYKVYTGLPLGIQPTDPHDTWNLCADALHPTLNWDVSGTTNGYEVEVYSDADLNNLVYLYQAVDTSSISHYANYDAGVCHIGANGFQNSSTCDLSYLGQYWWRVRVRNTDNVWGNWSTTDAFTVTSSHQWPGPDFTTNPENPQLGSVTHFLDQSTIYGGATAAVWRWVLSGAEDTDYQYVNSTSSTDQNPDITFLTNETENVTFDVTDSDGYGPCSCSKEATVTSGSIKWREVTPTP